MMTDERMALGNGVDTLIIIVNIINIYIYGRQAASVKRAKIVFLNVR